MSDGSVLSPSEMLEMRRSGRCDLSGRRLTALPQEICELTDLRILTLDGNHLATLPAEIGQLVGLRALRLDGNQLTEMPVEIGQLTHLQTLTLHQNRLTALPAEIGQLTDLETLTLDGNQLTALPAQIGQLAHLQVLRLDGNQLTALPAQIGQLTDLNMLTLDGNQLTALPAQIGQLTSLQTLKLDGNHLTALPAQIGQLTSLQTLKLDGNHLTALPAQIGQLARLRGLTLYRNQLKVLPAEIGQLANLYALTLEGNQLTALPEEIGQLTNLETLRLGGNQLTALPTQIGRLARLQTLMLDGNELTMLLPEIGQLANLYVLTLEGNQLTALPEEIGQLTNLETLRLDGNQLTALPPEMAAALDRGLKVELKGNPLLEPLPELIRQGARAVAVYLHSLRDSIAQYEAKVLLIGEGNVGKTSLSAALRGGAFVEGRPFTHGIEIRPVVLRDPDLTEDMTIRMWDFGGQEVYRITHQFFFSQRALYLIVWKPREGQEQNEVEGWLRRIRLRVGSDAQVLVVATHCAGDRHPDLDFSHLRQEFPGMLVGHFEVDNKTSLGISKLRGAIAKQAARLPQMGQEISSRWVAVRNEITRLARTQPQMSFQDFTAVCQRHEVGSVESATLATLMHDLGQIIYYGADEGLQDFVVLNPEWLTKAISYVLRDEPTRHSGGVLNHARLREIWPDGSGYPARYHRYFLRLMEKFDICYRLEDDQQSLVAQLVPYQRPELPWDFRMALPVRLRRLALVCQLSEPAPGLMAWLTVRHRRDATGKHWRAGVFLRHPILAYDSEALIELIAPTRLAVEVRAPSPDFYFHVLSDSIETLIKSRWPGLSHQLLIPCPTVSATGAQCPQLVPMEDLLAYREEGETRYLCARCRVRHDVSALLTGFPLPSQPLAAEMQQQLARVEHRLIRIEDLAADTAVVIRRVLRAVSAEVTDCPTLFTIAQDDHDGNKLQQMYRRHYRLTLWCMHPGYWHPWKPASYQIDASKDWVTKVSPYAALVVKALRLVVPLTGSIAVASLPVSQIETATAHLEMMRAIVDDLPNQMVKDMADTDLGDMTSAESDALRTLRVLIFEHDPTRKFGGLRRVQAPSGDFLWVCADHYIEYDPGLPDVP